MTHKQGWMPRVADDAIQARHRLDAALAEQLEAGWKPPCSTEPERWFSLDGPTIDWSMSQCSGCRVLTQCAAYAQADPVTSRHGIWAGHPDDHQRDVLARRGRCA
jgi:hypothetical protein